MKKILLADDDPSIADVITLVFEGEYDITSLSKGDALLNNAFELPDVFLIDKQLPGIDGLDICRFLKGNEATKLIPVIIISASPNIHHLAKSAGADDVIEKPFTIKELRRMVASHTT